MTFVPWSGLLGGAVAMGSPLAVAMGSLPPPWPPVGPKNEGGQTTAPRPREALRFA